VHTRPARPQGPRPGPARLYGRLLERPRLCSSLR
jgi:hypothetical protein